MADQGRVRRLHRSPWAREAEPPPPPPGIAVPAGSPFAHSPAAADDSRAPTATLAPPIGMPLTRAVQVLAVAWAVASAIAASLAVRALDIFDDRVGTTEWEDAHDLMNTAIAASFVVGAALLAFLVAYAHRATRATSRHGVKDRRWTPAWAAGGWFVPVANVAVPWLVFRENERIAEAAAGGRPTMWVHARLRASSNVWWLLTVAGVVMAAVGATMTGVDDPLVSDFSEVRRGYVLVASGRAAAAVGALCLAFVAGRTSRLDAEAT